MFDPPNNHTDDSDGGPSTETSEGAKDPVDTESTTAANPDPGADPRTRILVATITLLGELGWGQITTRKVAERANVNNALIHYYFGTKSKLLIEAATQVLLQQFGEPLTLLADPEVDVADGVAASIAWLGSTDLDPSQLRTLSEITVNGLREPVLAGLSRTMLAEGREALSDRLMHDGFDQARAEGVATIVFALLDGLLLHRIIDPDLRFDVVSNALSPLFRKEST